jgi:phosphoribosylanthranilate isomerase
MGFQMPNYICKIKVCGMTNLEDCQTAIDLGVDFIGFVFYKKSARYVTPEMAREISERINGEVKTVGVFVEEAEDEIDRLIDFCHLDFAQIYNNRAARENLINVYRVKDHLPEVAANGLVLFDSYSEGFGGTGTTFDANLLKDHSALGRAFIAGGIDEGNVYRALELKPFGIDFVSAVEKEKGKKDPFKMERLVKKVRSYQI